MFWATSEGWKHACEHLEPQIFLVAYVKYSSAYRQVEEDARVNQRGLWQCAFIAPWDWRHRNNKTLILGAFSVPIDAQTILLGPSAIVRFHWMSESEAIADGKKSSTNLHILMNWQKQGADWKLLSRAATKL